MALDLASCRSGRDGDLDAGDRWRRGFGEAAEFLRRPWRLACSWPGRSCSCRESDVRREAMAGENGGRGR